MRIFQLMIISKRMDIFYYIEIILIKSISMKHYLKE